MIEWEFFFFFKLVFFYFFSGDVQIKNKYTHIHREQGWNKKSYSSDMRIGFERREEPPTRPSVSHPPLPCLLSTARYLSLMIKWLNSYNWIGISNVTHVKPFWETSEVKLFTQLFAQCSIIYMLNFNQTKHVRFLCYNMCKSYVSNKTCHCDDRIYRNLASCWMIVG